MRLAQALLGACAGIMAGAGAAYLYFRDAGLDRSLAFCRRLWPVWYDYHRFDRENQAPGAAVQPGSGDGDGELRAHQHALADYNSKREALHRTWAPVVLR